MSEHTHTLYRFFDRSDQLLYVGRTVSPRRRWAEHEKSKDWFDDVAKVTRETFASATDLAGAERRAIQNESPLHNVVHNSKPRRKPASRPTWSSVDEFYIDRQMTLQGNRPELVPPCGEPDIEMHCECVACHERRWHRLDILEEDHLDDPVFTERVAQLRKLYTDGFLIGPWLDELFDIEIFRTLELAAYSKVEPAPALAMSTDDGLSVGCPFCLEIHDHFLRSGAAISAPLDSPCGSGIYEPRTSMDDHYNAWWVWIDREAKAARCSA